MCEYTIMMEQSHAIPDDLRTCQQQLKAALERIADLERQLNETCATAEELQRASDCLKEELLALKRMLFGRRSERLTEDPNQQHLFDLGPEAATPVEPPDFTTERPRRKGRKEHGRGIIPDHLERRVQLHDIPDAEKKCACGCDKARIGEDVAERLNFKPGELFVERHIYPKYACPTCKDSVLSAPVVPCPIAGGLAGPGLLAYVLVNKYGHHLPLYRQQDILTQHRIFLARSTLCGWLAQCADLFRPLVDLMGQEVLQSLVIQADETPVPVLDPFRDSTRTGYLWENNGDRDHPYTVYYYTDSRSRDGPANFFEHYHGYLQTDGYVSYESVVLRSEGRIIPVGCWAHVRREFFDARFNHPRESSYVLALISRLYDVEAATQQASDAERVAARQAQSLPVLRRLEDYLREQRPLALPKSQFGKAIGYALNQWPALVVYAQNGRLEIDNNFSERAIRPCAIGRKNWLFFGSDRGGETGAVCFSILANAKRHLIEPFAYVHGLLTALSSENPDLRSLLPDVWIKAHPEHFLQYRRKESEAAAKGRAQRRARHRTGVAEPVPPR